MSVSRGRDKGFATVVIVSGVVVATIVGGVLYFLRGDDLSVTTLPKEESAEISGPEATEGEVDYVLLRGLLRNQNTKYCEALGLERESCPGEAVAACRNLFDTYNENQCADPTGSLQEVIEACLIFRDIDGQARYSEWLDGDRDASFPAYYSIFGLNQDSFNQKDLAEAHQALLNIYRSDPSCSNEETLRLLVDIYRILRDGPTRSAYNAFLVTGILTDLSGT